VASTSNALQWDTSSGDHGFQGTVHLSFTVAFNGGAAIPVDVLVTVDPGFSTSGTARAVSNNPAVPAVLRNLELEQRLNYFGYRGKDGGPLNVTGPAQLTDDDVQAVRLFNGAVAGSSVVSQSARMSGTAWGY